MKIDIDPNLPDAGVLIRGYGPGEIRVQDDVITQSVMLTAEDWHTDWPPASVSELRREHLEQLACDEPEIVLLGTGARLDFPPHEMLADILARGIGVEVMDTGAACRTFNILRSEDRRVVAGMMMIEENAGR